MFWFKVKEILFGNWRNKGVALFFAVIIWLVAYQSETQRGPIRARLLLVPRTAGQIIIRQESIDGQGRQAPFDGYVDLSLSGPRRQVEKLRAEGLREVRLPVDAGADPQSESKRLGLGAEAFPFVPSSVKITSISPESISITFDALEEREFPVEPVYQSLPEGMEPETPRLDPAVAKLQGPRSILQKIRITVEPTIGAVERFEENVPLSKRFPDTVDKSLVEQHVRFVGPTQVKLAVRLRTKRDFFDAEGVRVRFLVPAVQSPFRIQFDEESVKVRFQGPVPEIRRLREKVRDPDFALGVRIPAPLVEGERTITFTEDSLLLYGFSDRIEILQHPERQAQGKGAWTYNLIPMAAASARPGGE